MSDLQETQPASADALMQLMFGRWPADMIALAAELGISDELASGPASAEELAARTATHPDALHRLMRALVSLGVYGQAPGGDFTLTPLGELLRSDLPGSLRQLATMLGQPWHARAWTACATACEPATPHSIARTDRRSSRTC
jgi:hypothetical protein